jgi:hypothetical protein
VTYVLASASGLVFGFWFFMAIAAAIAIMIYVLLTNLSARRPEFRQWAVKKPAGAAFAMLVFVVLATAMFLGSVAGFQRVSIDETGVRMQYLIPDAAVELRYHEIAEIMRRPASKSQWRLEIYTVTGNGYESVPGPYAEVKSAADEIQRRLVRPVIEKPPSVVR